MPDIKIEMSEIAKETLETLNEGLTQIEMRLDEKIETAEQLLAKITAYNARGNTPAPRSEILDHFTFDHLPEPLRTVSSWFAELAEKIERHTIPQAEKSVALRKLLESKDAAVRSARKGFVQ